MYDLAVVNGRCWLGLQWVETNLYLQDGVIVRHSSALLEAKEVCDARGRMVIPGLIDSHVHLDMQAGRYRSRDDFASGTRAAAHGGITTVIDFLDPRPSAAALEEQFRRRLAQAEGAVVDYALHTSVAAPEDGVDAHVELSLRLGMPSVKVYTTYRPAGLYGPPSTLARLLERSAGGDVLVMVHAELDELVDTASRPVACHGRNRPVAAELAQVSLLAGLTDYYQGYCYVAHVSAGSTARLLAERFGPLLNRHIWMEGCPHYFLFDSEVYKGEDGCLFTMTPPLRSPEERQGLLAQLARFWSISTDHCPFLAAEKRQALLGDIPMGVGGVEHSFSQMWALLGQDALPYFTERPARLQGLWPRKGTLQEGADGDVVILDDVPRTIGPQEHSRCDYSLYAGRTAPVTAATVLSRGAYVVREGEDVPHQGRYLARTLDLRRL